MPRTTLDTTLSSYLSYTGLSPPMVCFSKTILLDLMNQLCSPNPRCISTSGLGSFYFARHYFRNRFFFLFLWVLRCFSSPRSLLIYYFTHIWIVGLFFQLSFLIRKSLAISDMCSLPKLFAAYHVLRRLLVPRHSPYALSSLTFFGTINFVLLRQNSSLLRRHTICIVSLQLFFFLVLLVSSSKYI